MLTLGYSLAMLYQPQIPAAETLAAKLELQLQNGRYALVGANAVGVIAMAALFWFQIERVYLLTWAGTFLVLLLIRSLRMSDALARNLHQSAPRRILTEHLTGAASTGLVWTLTLFWLDARSIDALFYAAIVIITIISVVSISVTVVIRSGYLAYLFSTVVPIATFLAWHYDHRPLNLILSAVLTGLAVVMTVASGWMSRAFGELVQSNLERAAMTQDLSKLSDTLRHKNIQLEEARKRLSAIATVDELTSLRNRRAFNQTLETELSRSKRSGIPLALIMLDVDYFKRYNDTYGHPAGDVVLQNIAAVLEGVTGRAGEIAARYGGEEFLLLLPGSTLNDALNTAEVIKERIAELQMAHRGNSSSTFVTVSQGIIACVPRMDTQADELIDAADRALYESKQRGRNTISLSRFSP